MPLSLRPAARRLAPAAVCLLLCLGSGLVAAEPVPIEERTAVEPARPSALPLPDGDTSATDEGLAADALHAPAQALVDAHAEADRRALLQQSYQAQPPTWIQGAARVNLGDHPDLDDPTAQAEQQLRTLEWLIEQRRLDAAAARMAPVSEVAHGDQRWRQLLPGEWLPWLKTHRDEVIAASVVLLLGSWLWSVLPQRRRGRRHRRRHRSRSASSPAMGSARVAAPPPPPLPPPPAPTLRRRRRRRSHSQPTLVR